MRPILPDACRARLIGIARTPRMPLVTGEDAAIDAACSRKKRSGRAAFLDKAGKGFRAIVGNDPATVEWRSTPDFPNSFVIRESRAADLIIIGQSSTLPPSARRGRFFAQAGRPVLVVPSPLASFPARHAVMAWKDTREARRALRDPLPLLRLAENVSLVEVCEWGAKHSIASPQGRLWLPQHHITNVTERVLPDVAIAGDVLVRFVQRHTGRPHCRGGVWPQSARRMDVRWRHPRPADQEPDLLPVFPLTETGTAAA